MDKLFFDTSSLLMLAKEDIEKYAPIIISSISLKELENIKSSNHKSDEIKQKARKIIRLIDNYKDLFIVWNYQSYMLKPILKKYSLEPDEVNNDLKILATAYDYENSQCPDEMIFVSNDISLKNIANLFFGDGIIKSYNPPVEDDIYTGYKEVKLDEEGMASYYENLENNQFNLLINQYLIIKNEDDEVVDAACWTGETHRQLTYGDCNSKWFGKIKPKKNDIYQRLVLDSFYNHDVTMVAGKSGGGKTYLSFGYLFSELDKGKIDRIVIFCNPVVAKDAAKLGFYPGTVIEKLLSSQIGNVLSSKLGSMIEVERLIENEKVILIPTGDARGYEVPSNSGVYIMESQNLTKDLMRMILQRVGENCKIIIDGDYAEQVDMDVYSGKNNGMIAASKIFRDTVLYGQVELQNIHRSPIAALADKIR